MAKRVSANEGQGTPGTKRPAGGGAPAPGSMSIDKLLRDAVTANNLPEVKALLIRGADPNYQPDYGNHPKDRYYSTPTWAIAATNEYEDVLVALMEAGGNPDLQYRYEKNDKVQWASDTYLCMAIRNRRDNIARILLRYGADPNLLGYGMGIASTFTPLMRACENHSEEMVIALLKAGADPNAARDDGRTARDSWARIDAILGRFEARAMMRSHERLRLDPTKAGQDPRVGDREYDLADVPYHVMDNIQFMLGARPNPVPNSAGRGLAFAHIIL